MGISCSSERIKIKTSLVQYSKTTITKSPLMSSKENEFEKLPNALTVSLNSRQVRVLRQIDEVAKKRSDCAKPHLLVRYQALGFSEKDLSAVLAYIANDAPIIIHVFLDKFIDDFISDPFYRNLFETGYSHGTNSVSNRTSWVSLLFSD